jgi:hypothetical protein
VTVFTEYVFLSWWTLLSSAIFHAKFIEIEMSQADVHRSSRNPATVNAFDRIRRVLESKPRSRSRVSNPLHLGSTEEGSDRLNTFNNLNVKHPDSLLDEAISKPDSSERTEIAVEEVGEDEEGEIDLAIATFNGPHLHKVLSSRVFTELLDSEIALQVAQNALEIFPSHLHRLRRKIWIGRKNRVN